MNHDHYLALVGPCDEFTITSDFKRQLTTIHIRKGTHHARQVLTFVEQSECHVDLIAHTIERMVYDLTRDRIDAKVEVLS